VRVMLNPQNPQPRLLRQVVATLEQGGVIAYPTDTVYGIGCDIYNAKGILRIQRLKERDPKKPFSFICSDLSAVTEYAQVSNFAFGIMKRRLPGPYTFILEAKRQVPALLTTRQRTVGIRIPHHPVPLAIVRELGHPLVTTSVNLSGYIPLCDPDAIAEAFGRHLDLLVDSGTLTGEPSTVISLIGDRVDVLRVGGGDISWITEG